MKERRRDYSLSHSLVRFRSPTREDPWAPTGMDDNKSVTHGTLETKEGVRSLSSFLKGPGGAPPPSSYARDTKGLESRPQWYSSATSRPSFLSARSTKPYGNDWKIVDRDYDDDSTSVDSLKNTWFQQFQPSVCTQHMTTAPEAAAPSQTFYELSPSPGFDNSRFSDSRFVNAPSSNLPAASSLLYNPFEKPKSRERQEDELTVRNILCYQSYDGSFSLHPTHDMDKVLGEGFMTAFRKIERAFDRNRHLALTAAIIIVLELKFQSCKDLWSLVVDKARAFVERNVRRATCPELLQLARGHLRGVKLPKGSAESPRLRNQLNLHQIVPTPSAPPPPYATPASPQFAYSPSVNPVPSNSSLPQVQFQQLAQLEKFTV